MGDLKKKKKKKKKKNDHTNYEKIVLMVKRRIRPLLDQMKYT